MFKKIAQSFILLIIVLIFNNYNYGFAKTLYGWGSNGSGQLGDGTTTSRIIPTKIGNNSDWINIASGGSHTLAIKNDGTLWSWGANNYGQLGDGSTTNRNDPAQVGNSSDWSKIYCGSSFSIAIKNDGTLWSWGYNNNGQLGNGTIKSHFRPYQIGINDDWINVSCGDNHVVAIKSDGTLWSWGYNNYGQLGDSTIINRLAPIQIGSDNDWAKVSAGSNHSIAIKSDGTLWSWGYNNYGQLGDGTATNRLKPIKIGNDTTWSFASCGVSHSVAIKRDGTLWSWGYNSNGELGIGTTTAQKSPTQIGNDTTWSKISSGNSHVLAIKGNKTMWSWGYNGFGQLGDGTTTTQKSPIQVGTFNNWTNLSTGSGHSVALAYTIPSVSTIKVKNILESSATLGGKVVGDGDAEVTIRGVCWNTSGNPTIFDSIKTMGSGIGEFSGEVTGFSPYTTYYVRAFASNSYGTTYGDEFPFAYKRKIYVKYDAGGLNDGSSWENAFTSLQTALSYAEEFSEIWVARGTYKPTVKVNGNTNRHKTFLLKKRISLIGGFAGTESSTSQRNIENNPTILSGDIGLVGDSTDNCYHIVTYQVADKFLMDDLLDGFIIKYGNSNSENPDNRGAAIILNQNGNPTIQNCLLENNYTTFRGGAVYNAETAVNFNNCKFENNASTTEGGAIFNYYSHFTSFKNCKLTNNISDNGGGIYNYYSDSLKIDSCLFTYNSALNGGASFSTNGSEEVTNSEFSYNSVSDNGGALYASVCKNHYKNLDFNNNKSNYGGGVFISNCYNNFDFINFSYNTSRDGGAIHSMSGSNTFNNLTVSNNTANRFGGGISSGAADFIYNSRITNNTSASDGGGIYSSQARFFNNCIISFNKSNGSGGGVWSAHKGTFNNCLINNNTALNDGGGLYGKFILVNTTIANNESKKGAGIYSNDNNTIANSILWGNFASIDGHEIYKVSSTLTLDNTCFGNDNGDIFGIVTANNCINTDPIFVEPNDNDFRIYGVSPCVDAGNDDFVKDQFDIRGNGYFRFLDGNDSTLFGTVDMGAYEYKHGFDKLQPPALTTPVLIHPQNNDNEVGKVAEFKWRKVQNATGYRLQVSNTNTFAIKFINQVESDTVVTIEDLNPFMTQYWRVAALNQTDSLWSAVWTFTTNDIDQAAVTTNAITEIGAYSAKGGGNVTDDGDGIVIARGVCWNKTGNPTIANSKTIDSSGLGEFVSAITDLEKNTTYYVRAYATNIAGTVYGSQISFKTSTTVTPPSSWTYRSETGNNSSVILLKSVNPKVGDRPFQKGDALGAFYTRNGALVCAGYGIWNDENLAITVWGDDDQTTLKDGFEVEENYTFKIWDAQFGKELFGEFTIDTGFAYYTVNGISYLASLKNVDIITQGFYIKNGWNLISSFIIPENDSLESVYRNIENKLVIAKNGSGLVYIPSYGINSIGNWKYKDGYQVYMSSGDTLKITGMEVKPQNEKIILNNGWNLVSYLRNASKPITESLTSLTESGSLTIAKNTSGQVYIPSYEINTIGNMLPWQGYQMYISKLDTLIYPANSMGRNSLYEITPVAKYILPEFTETGNSAVLLLEIDGNNGDEIAVYNGNNQVIGSGVIHKNKASITIWGDNERTNKIDGSISSEKLKVKSYKVNTGRIVDVIVSDLVDVVSGNNFNELTYSENAFYIAKAKVVDNNSNLSMLVNPNPASDYIEITIGGESDNNTSLVLFNNEGKQITDLTSELLTLSGNKFRYNTTNLSSGTYNLILNSGNDRILKQLMIVK